MLVSTLSLVLVGGFQVNALLGDHAVLQQGEPIPVWGTGDPGDTITVTLEGPSTETHTATVAADGAWQVQFTPRPGQVDVTYTLSATNGTVTWSAHDLLVGELWLASGQSNMEWSVQATADRDASAEVMTNDAIREFKVPRTTSTTPRRHVAGTWKVASPQHTPNFSGVAWNFARRLQDELGVPVGIVNSTWGGSKVEAWMDQELLDLMRDEAPEVARNVDAWFEAQAAQVVEASVRLGPDEDDTAWGEVVLPADWAAMGLGDHDGVVLYRVPVWIPQSWAGQDLTLSLGPIDDNDETFWDGVPIGSTRGHTVPRNYTVPGPQVTPGRHVIGVRAVDMHGAGGFFGDKAQLRLFVQDDPLEQIPLAGPWKWKKGVGWARASQQTPVILNNAMIVPLEPAPFAGVIWYQGESNADDPVAYDLLFPAMIEDWRARFDRPLPFYFVQLANLDHRRQDWHWPQLREAQRRALRLPETGMALCFDVGDPGDIHPQDKATVGQRLARHALHDVYRRDVVAEAGQPVELKSMKGVIQVRFDLPAGELHTAGGAPVTMVEIAGADGVFHPAKVSLHGDTLRASSNVVGGPVMIRYGWRQDPAAANLLGADGLPVTPFHLPSSVAFEHGKALP